MKRVAVLCRVERSNDSIELIFYTRNTAIITKYIFNDYSYYSVGKTNMYVLINGYFKTLKSFHFNGSMLVITFEDLSRLNVPTNYNGAYVFSSIQDLERRIKEAMDKEDYDTADTLVEFI